MLCKTSNELIGIEIKAAFTWREKFAKQLVRFVANIHPLNQSLVVYNGGEFQLSDIVNALSYDKLVPLSNAEIELSNRNCKLNEKISNL